MSNFLRFIPQINRLSSSVFLSALLLLPQISFAQTTDTTCIKGSGLKGLVDYAICTINGTVIKGMFVIMVIAFTWGVIRYYILADDSKSRSEGRNYVVWGIFGFFIALSFVSLVGMVMNTFNFKSGGAINAVQINTTGGK